MKAKCIIMAVLFFVVANVSAQRPTDEVESLRGLNGVFVAVEPLDPDIEADGLRKDIIQTDVELKLRLAGIKVFTMDKWTKEPGNPYLYVKVGSTKTESVIYALSIDVRLCQKVFLARNPDIVVFGATTWNTQAVGTVGKQKVVNIRDDVKDQVDIFINDYLSVNPK